MERVNQIYKNPTYQEHIRKIKLAEENRIFGHHDVDHFLAVARIATIMNLEEGLGIDKELIYATALLHDIGRHVQYADGTPHDVASVKYAPEIMNEAGFEAWEQEEILHAIAEHRNAKIASEKSLAGIIYRADKASRACYACEVQDQCNRADEKRNFVIKY